MRFQRIYEAVYHQPWFITSSGYSAVREILDKAMKGEIKIPDGRNEGLDEFLSDFVRRRPAMVYNRDTAIAEISVFGVVAPHLSNIEKACGNTGYEEIHAEISEAIGQGARGIFFDFDSPGGSCLACDETAKAISECPLPTVGFSAGLMCSAAYYLCAGCDYVTATNSAIVGNIGVIKPWVDKTKLWDLEGLDFQPLTNEGADLKSTGHGPSISETQREFLQDGINATAALFHEHVLLGRENIKSEVWRAGWYSGQRALELGLIDSIGSRDDAMNNLKAML